MTADKSIVRLTEGFASGHDRALILYPVSICPRICMGGYAAPIAPAETAVLALSH